MLRQVQGLQVRGELEHTGYGQEGLEPGGSGKVERLSGCGLGAGRVTDQEDEKNDNGATLGPHHIWQQGTCGLLFHCFTCPRC